MTQFLTILTACLFLCAQIHAADLPAQQPLKDFRRVVIADDANAVQRAAAEELANYSGQIVGQKMEVLALSKLSADAPGLTFLVGDGAAARALGKTIEEYEKRTDNTSALLAKCLRTFRAKRVDALKLKHDTPPTSGTYPTP